MSRFWTVARVGCTKRNGPQQWVVVASSVAKFPGLLHIELLHIEIRGSHMWAAQVYSTKSEALCKARELNRERDRQGEEK